MFCSRVVSSYGKTAEWPFGSSFYLPSSGNRTHARAPFTGSFLRPRAEKGRGRGRLGVGGARWAALFYLGLVLNLILFNLISNIPILLLCQPSLPQPGHHPQLHPSCVSGCFGYIVIYFVLICFLGLLRVRPKLQKGKGLSASAQSSSSSVLWFSNRYKRVSRLPLHLCRTS